jgi:hypothetical protein
VLGLLLWSTPSLAAPLQAGDAVPVTLTDGFDFAQWVQENCPDAENGYLLYAWWPGCGPCRRHLKEGFADLAYPVISVCFYSSDDKLGPKDAAIQFLKDNNVTTPVLFTQDKRFYFPYAPCTLFVKDGVVHLAGILPNNLPHQLLPDITARVDCTTDLPEKLTAVEVPWGDTGNTVYASADPVNAVVHFQCFTSPDFNLPVEVKVQAVASEDGDHHDIVVGNLMMQNEETATLNVVIPVHTVALYVRVYYTLGDAKVWEMIHISAFVNGLGNNLTPLVN